jgi:hypothetical protein
MQSNQSDEDYTSGTCRHGQSASNATRRHKASFGELGDTVVMDSATTAPTVTARSLIAILERHGAPSPVGAAG